MGSKFVLLARAVTVALVAALAVPTGSAAQGSPVATATKQDRPPAATQDRPPATGMLDPLDTVLVDDDAFYWNMQGFDQEKVLTHGRSQYTVYWDASTNLTLVRRDLKTDAVQTLTFPDRLSVDDPHRNTALGVSTKDGRLHIVYDHHNNEIRYRVSKPGYLSDPPEDLSLEDFGAKQSILDPAEQRVTYPRFFNDRDGDLYFVYRHGGSGNGSSILGWYDAQSGTWHRVGLLFSRQGVYPPWDDSPTRNAYLSGILFDGNDRLHVSWLYREAGAATRSNHDVHYAYSDDYGLTWYNNGGTQIAELSAGDPIAIDDPGIVVVSVPGNTGLRGQSGIALDSRNQPHVLSIQSTVTTGDRSELNQHYIHHWRHPDGSWRSDYIDDTTLPYDDRLRRGNIFLDKHDNVHVYIPYRGTLWAAWATKKAGWGDWDLYAVPTQHPVADFPAADGIGFDRGRLEDDGVLTVPLEVAGGDNTGFALLDFKVKPTVNGKPGRPPAAPELSITADLGSSQPGLKLRWPTVLAADHGYNIYRRNLDGGSTELIASRVAANALNDGYLDADIEIGATYAYHVRAVNRYGRSEPSNTVYASIQQQDTAEWTDYRVEFDFGEISATTLAPTFRQQDTCHLYSWQIRNFSSEWAIRPVRIDDCNQRRLRDNVPLSFSPSDPDMHHMAVELRSGDIATYIDGQLSFELQDATYSAGPIGFRTSNAGGPAFVDNVRVTDAAGDVLFEEDFSSGEHAFVPDDKECAAEIVDGRLRIPSGNWCKLTTLYAVIGDSPPAALVEHAIGCRSTDAIVPVAWDQFGNDVDEGENAQLIKRILGNANRYALTTWYHEEKSYADQSGPYLDFGGTGENAIRPPTSEAFALAVSLATGAYDTEETGVAEEDARSIALQLIASTAYRHKANGVGGWGDAWQSALWAAMAGHAGWLLWDDLSPVDRDYVRKMVEHEANRFLDYRVPYYRDASGTVVSPGDSKAEENAWNALILQLATSMMPRHHNWSAWMGKNIELMISSFARPDDHHSRQVINGKRLSEWLNGSNVETEIPDLELGDRFGVVINHNRIHPDYMVTAYNNASAAYTYTLAGMPTPRAALFNADIMYNSLVDLTFPHPPFNSPGGTIYKKGTWDIYYPQSNDWGSGRQMNFVAIDVLADEFGFDDHATVGGDVWANRHAGRAYEMQERHPDGRMYADDSEDSFYSKEEFVAFLAARSYLTSWVSDRGDVRFTNRAYPARSCPHDAAAGRPLARPLAAVPPGAQLLSSGR